MKLNVKLNFDDRKVREAARKGCITSLRGAAAYIYKVARNSIRRRVNPDKHSVAGTPPYAHSTGMIDFKKSIMFSVDEKNMTAVIGPVLIKGGLGNAARLQEKGGSLRMRTWDPKEYQREIHKGDRAYVSFRQFKKTDEEVRTEMRANYDYFLARHRRGLSDPKNGFPVKMITIPTKQMAGHATRLKRRMMRAYSPIKDVKYPARPYMGPALTKSQGKIAPMWRNAMISN